MYKCKELLFQVQNFKSILPFSRNGRPTSSRNFSYVSSCKNFQKCNRFLFCVLDIILNNEIWAVQPRMCLPLSTMSWFFPSENKLTSLNPCANLCEAVFPTIINQRVPNRQKYFMFHHGIREKAFRSRVGVDWKPS